MYMQAFGHCQGSLQQFSKIVSATAGNDSALIHVAPAAAAGWPGLFKNASTP
jgi:hypothetical protein